MFTGLVEGLGAVVEVLSDGPAIRLEIAPPMHLTDDADIGDSIAINGCCLTIVEITSRTWVFQAGPETLAKTNLGQLRPGSQVNLERSIPVDGRLGGHFVQGHVDGVGHVEQLLPTGEWVTLVFHVPAPLARQMVPKGSVAVDGVSLTVVDVGAERFSVALIPHTLQVTTLGLRRPGDAVNIETDLLAKYVQKLLESAAAIHEVH